MPWDSMHRRMEVQCRCKYHAGAEWTPPTCTPDVRVAPCTGTVRHRVVHTTGRTWTQNIPGFYAPAKLLSLPHSFTGPSPTMVVLLPLPEPCPLALLFQ